MMITTTMERRESAEDIAARLHAMLAYKRVKPGGYAAWATDSGARAWVMEGNRKVVFEAYGDKIIVTESRLVEMYGQRDAWKVERKTEFDPNRLHCVRTSPTMGGLSEAIHYFAACAKTIQESVNA